MNRTALALLVAAPLAAACAGSSRSLSAPPAASRASPATLATTTGSREKMLCQAEKPVGSNMARMVCRTQEQIDAESRAAQDAIHLMPKSGETIRP